MVSHTGFVSSAGQPHGCKSYCVEEVWGQQRWAMTGASRVLLAVILISHMEKSCFYVLWSLGGIWMLWLWRAVCKSLFWCWWRGKGYVLTFLPLSKCLGIDVLICTCSTHKAALSLHVWSSCPDLVHLLTQRKPVWAFWVLSAVGYRLA